MSSTGVIPRSADSIWLKSPVYDLFFFQLSVFIGLISLVPYYRWGLNIAFMIYIAQSLLAGGPHIYLTFVTLSSRVSRKNMSMSAVYPIALVSALGGLAVVLFRNSWASNLMISVTFFLAGWHSYRQHHGISKIYDYVLSKRWQDPTLTRDMRPLYWFYGLAMNAILVYAFSIPEVPYMITRDWMIQLMYPHFSVYWFYLYLVITLSVGAIAIYKTVFLRLRNRRRLPVPQLLLMATSLLTALILYTVLPPQAYMLMWLIPTLGHNIQYFGFVWLFEKHRVEFLKKSNNPLDGPLVLVEKNQWARYFSISYALALITIALAFVGYTGTAVFITYFVTLFHYIGDGFLWKKSLNRHVIPVSQSLVGAN